MGFECLTQEANPLAAQLVERMGIAYNNSDKVGKLYWCTKDYALLYWYRQSFFPSKFFARLSTKESRVFLIA